MSEANEAGSQPGSAHSEPTLRVVNPDATPEEIAALVAVFSSLGDGQEPPKRKPSEWSSVHRRVRVNYSHGPGGWRSSGLPR